MKRILNICVNGVYTEGYSYHENLLPKYHKKLGYDVYILASEYEFDNNGKIVISDMKKYTDDNGTHINRLAIKNGYNIQYRFKRFVHFYDTIEEINPDIIFCHLFQFLDFKYVLKYKQLHPDVRLYVDSHADYGNSARTFLSKHILHGIIWKYYAQLAIPYAEKFYGVLPARVDFLSNVYKLPQDKVQLLVMGVDDELAADAENEEIRQGFREQYGIKQDDFLIVTGGKIDDQKAQVLTLMDAVNRIQDTRLILLVFGPVSESMQDKFTSLCSCKVKHIGWISTENAYKLFLASDLVVFPSTHSVYWEQVAGLGIPMVVKYWKGVEHIDLGGNVRFLYQDSAEEIIDTLEDLRKPAVFQHMSEIARLEGKKKFSYMELAKNSIED